MLNNQSLRKSLELDWSYGAGFFDGEGCISITKHAPGGRSIHPSYRLTATISNTDESIMEWWSGKFDGSSYVKKDSRGDGRWRPLFTWSVTGHKASYFLKTIQPYLRAKRAQADVALRFQAVLTRRTGNAQLTDAEIEFREQCRQELSELKKVQKHELVAY